MKRILYVALLFLCATVLLSIGPSVNNSCAADSAKIAIAYSGNAMGYLEPCG
jgi:hypothetical protein